MAETIKIGGELESMATGNIVTRAHRIYDEEKGEYQSQINAETISELATHESRLNAYTEGKFVTVDTYSGLPATGAVDTVYRVSSWDGTANSGQGAVDVTKYSEYAWENGAYKFLDVKTQIGEVFDISEYNNDTYDDLAAALGTNGANVPEPLRRGGMSVKFVQSSDNKYVQYRLAASNWSTDIHDWTSEDPYFIDKIMQEVNEAIDEHTPIEIHGDVSNAPDEEDLTSVNVGGTDVLKFKDKTYNPLTYSGMGRKILRKNIVNGVNTLTQSMMQATNTIYVIQYDFTLGENITIPANCVLEFEGGTISNGTIIGNNTVISADLVKIFGTDIQFDGTFLNKTIYIEWFGAVPEDDSKAIQNVSAINAACAAAVSHSGDNVDDVLKSINSVTLQPKLYYVNGTLRVPSAYFHFGAEEEKPMGYVNHRMATIQEVSNENIPVITLINREIDDGYYREGIDHLIIENIKVLGNGRDVTTYGIGKEVSDPTDDSGHEDARKYLMWIADTKLENVAIYYCRYGIYFSLPRASYVRTFYANKLSCRDNVIGFYIKTYVDSGKRNACWMNVNKFIDCLFTNNTLWGIFIGKMFNDMVNTVFEGGIIQDNGLGYSYSDYAELGAGGIRLIFGAATFNNCYWEGNYARKNPNESYDSRYEELITVTNPVTGAVIYKMIEPKHDTSDPDNDFFKWCDGNVVVGGGRYLTFNTCTITRAHRLICVQPVGLQNEITINGGLIVNSNKINYKTSETIVNYFSNTYPQQVVATNVISIRIVCKDICYSQSPFTTSVYKIYGSIGTAGAFSTRRLIKECLIDIDARKCQFITNKLEKNFYGKFEEGVKFYIDPTNGYDKNIGTNPDSPLKTLEPIYTLGLNLPYNVNIVLMGDYHTNSPLPLFNEGEHNYIFSSYDPEHPVTVTWGNTTSAALRFLTLNEKYQNCGMEFRNLNVIRNLSSLFWGTIDHFTFKADNCTFQYNADVVSLNTLILGNLGGHVVDAVFTNCSIDTKSNDTFIATTNNCHINVVFEGCTLNSPDAADGATVTLAQPYNNGSMCAKMVNCSVVPVPAERTLTFKCWDGNNLNVDPSQENGWTHKAVLVDNQLMLAPKSSSGGHPIYLNLDYTDSAQCKKVIAPSHPGYVTYADAQAILQTTATVFVISLPINIPAGSTLNIHKNSRLIFIGAGRLTGDGYVKIDTNPIECCCNRLFDFIKCQIHEESVYATGQVRFNPTDVRMEMFNGTDWVNLDGSALS